MHPLMRKMLAAVFPGHFRVKRSPLIPVPSPVQPAAPVYTDITRADAVARLAIPSGDKTVDRLQSEVIDCIQRGYLRPVVDPDGELCFDVTALGKEKVREYLEYLRGGAS